MKPKILPKAIPNNYEWYLNYFKVRDALDKRCL
jgi:hypothetical protein